jgi:hypothetical protein
MVPSATGRRSNSGASNVGQAGAAAAVDARAEQHVFGLVAVQVHPIRVSEYSGIPVGGDPHERDPFAGGDLSTIELDVSGGRAVVGDERSVDAQDLPDCRAHQLGTCAKARLKVLVVGELLHDDPHRCGHRAVARCPRAQQGHDLFVVKRPAVDGRAGQLTHDPARGRGGPFCLQDVGHIEGKLASQPGAGLRVTPERGILVAVRPAADSVPVLDGPAHEAAEGLVRERVNECADRLHLGTVEH